MENTKSGPVLSGCPQGKCKLCGKQTEFGFGTGETKVFVCPPCFIAEKKKATK